ncbi:tape measure protein, partial [Isoptericola halotolerans]
VFIQAQQQMLGFGVEAEKVVPALSAIQDAVAAMGGSNEQIAAISEIMARINSESRLSGDALQRLGYYGIDAAQLIGDQMGKTASEIRDMASKPGGIPAAQVWDPLVNGMQEEFAGAADGVKETFAGAVDRVKAAWRDFGAELAKPLVDPEGGGALVDLLNWAADMMRAFERLPEPLQNTATALAVITAAVGVLGGGFALLTPRIVAANAALTDFATRGKGAALAVKGVRAAAVGLPAVLGAAAVAFGIWATSAAEARAETEAWKATLDDAGNTTADSMTRLSEVLTQDQRGWLDRLAGADFYSIKSAADDLGLSVEQLAGYIQGVPEDIAAVTRAAEEWDASQKNVNDTEFYNRGRIVTDMLDEQRKSLGLGAEEARAAGSAADDLGAAQDGMSDSAYDATAAMEEQQKALEAAEKALEDWRDMVAGADASFIGLTDGFQSVIDKNREMAEEAAVASGDAEKSWEDFYDGTTVSMKEWIAELEAQATAQANWRDNILSVTRDIREQMPADMAAAAHAMVDELIEAGPAGAAALQTFADASPKQRERLVEAWRGTGGDIVEAVESERNPVIQIEADGSIAERDLGLLLDEISKAEGTLSVEGDTIRASEAVRSLTAEVNEAEGTVTIYGADGEAVATLRDYVADVDATDGTVTILGKDDKGRATVVSLTDWIDDQGASVKVDADTSNALKSLELFRSEVTKPMTTTVNGKVVFDFAANGKANGFGDGEGHGWPGTTPRGVGQMTQAVKSLDPGAQITSGYRPGAVTATGRPSYHGMGRAVDIVSPNMGRTFDLLAQAFGSQAKELYYTPRGFIRNGRRTNDVADVTRRTHNNHVHLALAAGGGVRGPGTGTSDSIPALLSNGEHVWTAKEVQAAGGHGAIEAMRRAVLGQVEAFAAGGAVGSADRALGRAQERRDRARERAQAARAAQRNAERALSDAQKGGAPDSRVRTLERRVRDAEKRTATAEQRLDERRQAVQDQRARRGRLREERRELRTDVRRGAIQDQATGSLSGAYAVADDMMGLARSGDLTKKQSNRLADASRSAEREMRKLYAQAEKIEKRLADARDRVQELGQISSQVSNTITGGFSLADAASPQQRTNARGEVWYDSPTGKSMLAKAKAYAGRAKKFALTLRKLEQQGFSGAVLQEVASMGVEGGQEAADALLQLSKSDAKQMNAAYKDIEYWAGRSGQVVTEGFYKGGLSAAEGLVAGLEKNQKKIESQIEKVAKGMENALKRALGINSPSRVFRDLMHHVGDGAVLGLRDSEAGVSKAAANLVALPSAVSPSVYATPVGNRNPVKVDVGNVVAHMSDAQIRQLGEYIVTAQARTAAGVVAGTTAAQDNASRYVTGVR